MGRLTDVLPPVFSIPDSRPDWGLIVLEVQSGQDQLLDSDCDREFDCVSPSGLYLEDVVFILLTNVFDGPDRPPFAVVCRFSCVDSIVSRRC